MQSLADIYKSHHQRIRRTIYRIQGDEGLDDLVQDAFLKAWAKRKSFRDQSLVTTWIYRIATHVAIDALRKRQDRVSYSFDDERDGQVKSYDLTLARQVRQAVACLPEKQRVVMVLFYFEELALSEIAEILQIPAGTVKSRLHSAKESVQTLLESKGDQVGQKMAK